MVWNHFPWLSAAYGCIQAVAPVGTVHEDVSWLTVIGPVDGSTYRYAAPSSDTSPLAQLKIAAEEWPRKILLPHERDMLGLYVSAHPLDGTERILRKHAPRPIAALLEEAPKEGEIVLAGMIAAVDRRVNKKGESWAIVTIEDLDAAMEVLFFPKSYIEMGADLVPDTAVAVRGRVNWRDGVFPGCGLPPMRTDGPISRR